MDWRKARKNSFPLLQYQIQSFRRYIPSSILIRIRANMFPQEILYSQSLPVISHSCLPVRFKLYNIIYPRSYFELII
jgi:hypothetical protein